MTSRGDCRAQLDELFGWLDGELSAARCRAIERHLERCPCCAGLAVGLRRAIALCRASGRERLPSGVRRQALARIARLLDQPPPKRVRSAPARPRP